jgi:hypothetical protein
VHDFTPGVLPNRLFWTIAIPDDAFHVGRKRAVLDLHDTPLCDSIFFGNCEGIASQASTRLVWRATTEPIERGEGAGADPNMPGAFSGQLSDATCKGRVSGRHTGFHYRTPGKLDASGFYANFGHLHNGAFLT